MAVVRPAAFFAAVAVSFVGSGGLLLPLPAARAQTATAAAVPLAVGVREDMTGVCSDATGKPQIIAARMAADDFGGAVRPLSQGAAR